MQIWQTQEPEGQRWWDGGARGRIRANSRVMHNEVGLAKSNTAATKTMAARASRRRNETGDSQVSSVREGVKYHVERNNQEESSDESAEGSGKEREGLATEEETETVGETGEVRETRTETERVSTGIGAGNDPEGATAGGGQ